MNKLKFLFLSFLIWLVGSDSYAISFSVFPNTPKQVIEGFGASDFSADVVGSAYPDFRCEQAIKWLFDSTFDPNGNPNGIGLNQWRFAIGPYVEDSSVPDGFIMPDGSYNWSLLSGKQHIIDRALEYGCQYIDVWAHDRPVVLRTGDFYSSQLPKYAKHIVTILDYLINTKKYPVKYIAPVNEPQYDWNKGHLWSSSDIAQLVRLLSTEMVQQGINIPILLGEASDWGDLKIGGTDRAHNQIYNYFNTSSPNYIGDVPLLAKEFATHSYWTDQNPTTLKSNRDAAKYAADSYGIKLHQTEWSMLSEYDLPSSTHMQRALILARTIYSDFKYANVASWTYWEALTTARNDSRFHLINAESRISTIGDRKNLWALGNYSLFVRNGYSRVECTGPDDMTDVVALAFASPSKDKLVVVYTNFSTMDSEADINLRSFEYNSLDKVEKYVTSELLDLQPLNTPQSLDSPVIIPAKSVTTVIYHFNAGSNIEDTTTDEKYCSVYPSSVSDGILNIEIKGENKDVNTQVLISDISGKIFYNQSLQITEKSQINLPPMTPGIYIVTVNFENKRENFRIVVI